MNSTETRTLWISIGAAVIAVFLLYSYTQEKASELTKTFGQVSNVVIAKGDINEMQTINESMLEIMEVPTKTKQPNAISDPQEIVGRVALVPIGKGEQLLTNKVTQPGTLTGLALQVTPTKRAVTIPIDETRGVGKLLRPGDRIDIIAALDVGKGLAQHREVKTILQDVTILAAGMRISNELPRLLEQQGREEYIRNIKEYQFNHITVEVSQDEAQDLVYILSTSPASLFLSLRHPTDRDKKSIQTSTIEGLLGRVSQGAVREQVRTPSSFPQYEAPPTMAAPVMPQQDLTPKPPTQPKRRKGGPITL